jgi:hypothetical protein
MEQGMEGAVDIEAELQAFKTEIEGTEWQARLTRLMESRGVCLRIERCIEGVEDPAPHALEICRRTFEEAARSARKHIHKHA